MLTWLLKFRTKVEIAAAVLAIIAVSILGAKVLFLRMDNVKLTSDLAVVTKQRDTAVATAKANQDYIDRMAQATTKTDDFVTKQHAATKAVPHEDNAPTAPVLGPAFFDGLYAP